MKRSTFFARTVAVIALFGGTLAVAAPAQAAIGNCPSGAACIWGDLNYQTNGLGAAKVGFQQYIPNYSLWHFDTTNIGANDAATSLYNNGNLSPATFYRDANKGGWSVTWDKKTGSADLRANGVNDAISSGYFAGF